MILEGIVTTRNADGSTNVSPMGPIVDESMSTLRLRPFKTSTTYANLKRTGVGILHVTDNVEMLAKAAVGNISDEVALTPCSVVDGMIIDDACRWYAFAVDHLDDAAERTCIDCTINGAGRLRDFFGWNRAKHAVLETAILATRLHLAPYSSIQSQLTDLQVIVAKTAGPVEKRAFDFLMQYIKNHDIENHER